MLSFAKKNIPLPLSENVALNADFVSHYFMRAADSTSCCRNPLLFCHGLLSVSKLLSIFVGEIVVTDTVKITKFKILVYEKSCSDYDALHVSCDKCR